MYTPSSYMHTCLCELIGFHVYLLSFYSFCLCVALHSFGCAEVKPPVAIDNTYLLEQVESADGSISYKLDEEAPFRRVSQSVWQYFHRTYGGGPVLVSSLVAIFTNNSNN